MRKYQVGLLISFCISTITTTASADISKTYNFSAPQIETADKFSKVTIPALYNIQQAGKPALPFRVVRVLLPSNEEISGIEVIRGTRTFVANNLIVEPGKLQVPLSKQLE